MATLGAGAPVVGALAGAISTATGVSVIAAGAIAGGLLVGAVALLKPKLPSLSSEFGRELQLSGDPVAPRKVCYGEAWTAGTLRFRGAVGDDNEDLYMVIVLAGHEIDSVQEVEIDRTVVTIDGGGDVTFPTKYDGLVNIRFYLGTDDQTADGTLVGLFSEWTTNHRLRGLPFAIVRCTFDEADLNSVPQFRFKIRGRKVYDPRLDSTNGGSGSHRLDDESTWEWSDNAVLCGHDFLRSPKVGGQAIAGLGVADTRIDWANVIAEANICDESVTLAAGGTQSRYTTNGILDPRQDHGSNIRHFEVAMAGDITLSDGKWRFFAGAYRAPTLSLEDKHFIGPLKHLVHKGEDARVDTAQGIYASLSDSGAVLDYPPVQLATAVVGQEKVFPLDFALVNNSPQAQRCAKILLQREAAGKSIDVPTSLYGYRCVPGETVEITHAAFGLTAQDMRVIDVQLTTVEVDEDKIGLSVDLRLEAGPSSLYSWDAEETDLAAPPTLPNAEVPFPSVIHGNSIVVPYVYLRKATPPSTPAVDDGSYNFATKVLTPPSISGGSSDDWSASIPAGSDPLYVSVGTFEIEGVGGVDSTVVWSTPVLFVQDGTSGSSAMNLGRRMRSLDKWFTSPTQAAILDSADGWSIASVSGPMGSTALQIVDNDDASENVYSERMTINALKKYRVSVWARQPSGDRQNYLLVTFYDDAGDEINSGSTPASDATGWDLVAGSHYWVISDDVFASGWANYTFDFGGDSLATIPTGAVTFAIGGLFTRDGAVGTETTVQLQDLHVVELAVAGIYRDMKFQRSTSRPATPTGDNPAGWYNAPPSGNETLWMMTGSKTGLDKLIGAWSDPERISDIVSRGPYSDTADYLVLDWVTYQERSYVCVQDTTGNAPSGSNAGNAYWDLLAGKGDTGATPTAFIETIAITGTGPVNLRALADAYSPAYDGVGDATITFTVAGGVTLTGNAGAGSGGPGGAAIDTGTWPMGATIDLELEVTGTVRGGGGAGGKGGGIITGGGNAGDGGDAIYCQEDIDITVESGGVLQAGGGGGGGGGALSVGGVEPETYVGGGGGGGFPNGAGGPRGSGGVQTGATDGSAGTGSGGGAGGDGALTAGDGGDGGGVNAAGDAGGSSSGAGGSEGDEGYAIRENGYTVGVTNNGTITGTVG